MVNRCRLSTPDAQEILMRDWFSFALLHDPVWRFGAHLVSGGHVRSQPILVHVRVIGPCGGTKFVDRVLARVGAAGVAAQCEDLAVLVFVEVPVLRFEFPDDLMHVQVIGGGVRRHACLGSILVLAWLVDLSRI